MTFEQFQVFCADQQRSYIRDERWRFTQARELANDWGNASFAIQKAMFAPLNLWPLTLTEIADRFTELDKMEARIPEDFSDTPTMRFSYECWLNHT